MKLDCIIVLANEMDVAGNLNAESKGRIDLACDTYFDHPGTPLITCGWDYRKDSPLFIGEVLKKYAIDRGVPAEHITAEINSRDTVGDAVFSKLTLVNKTDWRKILVVTTDYHVARTREIFHFVYGPLFEIEVIGATPFDTPEKQIAEQASIDAFKRTFEGIEPGDDSAIYERLSARHPFYNGDIYPTIILS